jgi:proline racemase
MCGHAVIALTKLAVETGRVRESGGEARLSINVPAGTVQARAIVSNGQVISSAFRNVPSFVYLRDQNVDVPGIGTVQFDVAYGGAFYAIVDADELSLDLTAREYNRIIDWGRRIKTAVMAQYPIEHPFEQELSFLYGTIFTGHASDPRNHSRNVTVFAEGEVDRSATGSGVSARAALHHARGELGAQQEITIESILGSTMSVRVVDTTNFGPYDAVVPEVSGTASYTGRHEFWFDPADPLSRGFIFR